MTERPILFTPDNARKSRQRLKWETRRVVTSHTSEVGSGPGLQYLDLDRAHPDTLPGLQPAQYLKAPYVPTGDEGMDVTWSQTWHRIYPRIQPGDLLWVRETFSTPAAHPVPPSPLGTQQVGVRYRADGDDGPLRWFDAREWMQHAPDIEPRWRPSIFMPKWAARTWCRVTDVWVERVQDISEQSAVAEGYDCGGMQPASDDPAREWFRALWDSINAARGHGWDVNDWVWAIRYTYIPDEDVERVREEAAA